jgi:hypothetical protein
MGDLDNLDIAELKKQFSAFSYQSTRQFGAIMDEIKSLKEVLRINIIEIKELIRKNETDGDQKTKLKNMVLEMCGKYGIEIPSNILIREIEDM